MSFVWWLYTPLFLHLCWFSPFYLFFVSSIQIPMTWSLVLHRLLFGMWLQIRYLESLFWYYILCYATQREMICNCCTIYYRGGISLFVIMYLVQMKRWPYDCNVSIAIVSTFLGSQPFESCLNVAYVCLEIWLIF